MSFPKLCFLLFLVLTKPLSMTPSPQWYCGWVSAFDDRRHYFSFTLDGGKASVREEHLIRVEDMSNTGQILVKR
jgi:hypothetical protein